MMTEEEWQRKMEFIVEHQAQFAADIQRLSEAQVQADARMKKIEEVVLKFANQTESRFGALANQTENRFADFDERMKQLAEAQARTQARVAEIAEMGAETDIRLNNLMMVVERHIAEGRNGKS